MRIYTPALALILCLSSCLHPHHHTQTKATFPDVPVNLAKFNSFYDDYNSTLPLIDGRSNLIFSSKRNSKGENFDFIYKVLDVTWFFSGTYQVGDDETFNTPNDSNLVSILKKINTTSDELGPHLFFKDYAQYPCEAHEMYIFLYSNNQTENQDIYFTHNTLCSKEFVDLLPVSFLNSDADDAYPSIKSDSSYIFFCSNREGNFDIYQVALDDHSIVTNLGSSDNKIVEKVTSLSSSEDDKCPFVNNNVMVFSSNRAGGFGGYDLYYSLFQNGAWSAPVNFGNKINSEFDEYRPIINITGAGYSSIYYDGFTNDFMIFSSNRPGGVGGFDLYYVGVDRIVQH